MTAVLEILKVCWPYLLSLAIGFFAGFKLEQVELLSSKLESANESLGKWQEDAKQSKLWMDQYKEAQVENAKQRQQAAVNASRLNSSLNSLQSDLTEAKRRLASASPEASARAATTCIDILGNVERAGGEIAKAADGHVRDVKQLMAVWPEKKE